MLVGACLNWTRVEPIGRVSQPTFSLSCPISACPISTMGNNDQAVLAHNCDDDDDDGNLPVTCAVTVPEILPIGLTLAGCTNQRLQQATIDTNLDRFIENFGVMPIAGCAICEDMQRTAIPDAWIDGNEHTLKKFFVALFHLRECLKEIDIESKFNCLMHWGRNSCWNMMKRTQAMKPEKIVWPDGSDSLDL